MKTLTKILSRLKIQFILSLVITFLLPTGSAIAATPRDYPELPAELASSGISVPSLREILYEPLYRDNPATGSDFSHLEAGTAFVGGQGALNTQISYVQTNPLSWDSSTKICEGYFDANCAGERKVATVILPVCEEGLDSACISGLALSKGSDFFNGNKIGYVNNEYSDSAKFAKYQALERNSDDPFWSTIDTVDVQTLETWSGIPSKHLPEASSPSKWQVEGVNNAAGTNTYSVNARVTIVYQEDGSYEFNGFTADVVPYKEIAGNRFEPPFWTTRDEYNSKADRDAKTNLTRTTTFPDSPNYPLSSFDNPGQGNHLTCAFEEIDEANSSNSKCGVAVRFADDTTVRLSLRIPKELGGWFHGRLANTDAELSEFNSYLNSLLITAKPVDVPISSYQFEPCNPEYKKYADKAFSDPTYNLDWFCNRSEKDGLGSWSMWNPGQNVKDFTDFEALMDERAKGIVNTWSISNLNFDSSKNNCFSDTSKIQGFISTNAMVYQAGIPVFKDGKFKYQIASTHYDANGEVIRGDYTLEVRSSIGRCLWNLGGNPLRATAKVLDGNANEKTAESTFSDSNGWIRLNVRNFTFSESNVELNISEAATTDNSKVLTTPQLSVKQKINKHSVLSQLGLSPSKKASVSVKLSKSSLKFCKLVGSNIVAKKTGTCLVTFTIQEPKPKVVKLSSSLTANQKQRFTSQQLVESSGRTWIKKSSVKITVLPKSKKVCSVVSGKLSMKKDATCYYSLSIYEPKPKPVKVTTQIKVN